MIKHFTESDELLRDFMVDREISIDKDMFMAYFAFDKKCTFTSPSYASIAEVVAWLKTNMKSLDRRLN